MTNPDIVIVQSQRLTDAANGGGSMTSTIIPDNQANNLFGPISRVNRADGNVSLRKAIVKALASDTSMYLGAHVIIAQPPTNPDVTALMFSTGSWTDVRSNAVEFVESYLVQGPQTRLWPYGQQVAGQRSIIAYQPVADLLPSIGDSYCIALYGVVNGVLTLLQSQFVRIKSLSNSIQTFSDAIGTYQLNIVTMGITEPLTAFYPGSQAQRYSTPAPLCVMCQTTVANAANYYGCTTLAADASIGDEEVSVTSIFGQLIPSSLGETPVTNASPQGANIIAAAATSPIIVSTSALLGFAGTVFLGKTILPGSLQCRDSSSPIAVDDGLGNICLGTTTGAKIGSVDYVSGRVVINTALNIYSCAYIPAVSVQQAGYFAQQPVTQATRGYLWIQNMMPLPSPGSASVSYRALGRWYTLQDDGSGNLVGPTGAGSGTIKFDTGICTITTGALPDIDSNIVFSWGQSAQYNIRAGDVAIQNPAVSFTLSNPAKPSSVTISWTSGATNYSVVDNGSGSLTGNGTGTINYASGEISLKPTTLPNPTDGFSIAYQTNPATTTTFTPSKSGASISFTIPGAPLAPKSVSIKYTVVSGNAFSGYIVGFGQWKVSIIDDGAGNLFSANALTVASGGTIDYTTGVVTFNPDIVLAPTVAPVYNSYPEDYWDGAGFHTITLSSLTAYAFTPQNVAFVNGTNVSATATAASATNIAQTDSFPAPPIIVDLTPTTVQPIVPGSVMFIFAGDTYIDRAGVLYRSVSQSTNSGTAAGTLDYTTGSASITNWIAGGSKTISVVALLCEYGNSPVGVLCGRVPGQAIRPSSFIIQANRRSDATLITATADSDGNWSTADMLGHIDYATGFFTVRFGALVLDSSLTSDQKAEPWYNSTDIDGTGHIWYPNEALSGTVKYSCVVQTTLPLSAGVLGLDPVRLPSDGRVPIISAGNTLVFRNPLTYTFTGTVIAGSTTSLPRGALESAVLYDSAGTMVDIGLYTTDLTAGSVTINVGADISIYTQPFVCTHTRGEMVLCTDAEITGQISFAPALVNDYPHTSSYVSSALIGPDAGNLQASYNTKFVQTTWNFDVNDLWDDVVHGTSPTPNYNDVDYPIQVTDHDTITQRVALIFTSSTGGNIAFEDLGIVGTFTTSANVAPINPATGNPYFILDYHGFGTGWATGNAIRFNLQGAGFPVWWSRSVQVGASASLDDSFTVETRWDK